MTQDFELILKSPKTADIFNDGEEIIELTGEDMKLDYTQTGEENEFYDSETIDIGDAFTLPTLIPLNNQETFVYEVYGSKKNPKMSFQLL